MKEISTKDSLRLAETAFRRGVPLKAIVIDCWSRGIHIEQCRHECIQMGYSLCIAEKEIARIWKWWDDAVLESMKAEQM